MTLHFAVQIAYARGPRVRNENRGGAAGPMGYYAHIRILWNFLYNFT